MFEADLYMGPHPGHSLMLLVEQFNSYNPQVHDVFQLGPVPLIPNCLTCAAGLASPTPTGRPAAALSLLFHGGGWC